ncbi:MAG: SUMF1/EgtB/PvdO family nonheme iron enzyme [Nitrospirae bacterium]|nr:SUMF1/EgtB/PvdO family nonheme iron enzyme [Nitrospirota bacterium]
MEAKKMECPVCSNLWPAGTKLCSICGYDLQSEIYLSKPTEEEIKLAEMKLDIARKNWLKLQEAEKSQRRLNEIEERLLNQQKLIETRLSEEKKKQDESQSNVDSLVNAGESYLKQGRYDEAVKLSESILKISPANARAQNLLLKAIENQAVAKQVAKAEVKKVTTGSVPKSNADFIDTVTDMEFILVKGGCFQMGDTFDDGKEDEKPVHEVCLDDFYIGKYPVAFDEYDFYCQETGKKKPNDQGWGRGRRPVISVSFYDAADFAEWLSNQTGRKYRLLTEAEWEYACRSGGKKEKWAGTSQKGELYQYAWYNDNSGAKTHPVGEKEPNGLGIYDMSGNVWEWVQDVYIEYHADAYKKLGRNNPIYIGDGGACVYRGGSWDGEPRGVRCAYRSGDSPGSSYRSLGFRLGLEE